MLGMATKYNLKSAGKGCGLAQKSAADKKQK